MKHTNYVMCPRFRMKKGQREMVDISLPFHIFGWRSWCCFYYNISYYYCVVLTQLNLLRTVGAIFCIILPNAEPSAEVNKREWVEKYDRIPELGLHAFYLCYIREVT